MLIQHSQPVIMHRMARIEAQSLEVGPALIAKYTAEQMIAQAVESRDLPTAPVAPSHQLDTKV